MAARNREARYQVRPDGHGPLTLTLDGGQVLTLPPGLVWIDVTA